MSRDKIKDELRLMSLLILVAFQLSKRNITMNKFIPSVETVECIRYVNKANRVKSFEKWPIPMKQRIDDMAEAGFYLSLIHI